MAAYVELYIDQGADFSSTINLTDDVTNAPINVANYVITSQIKRSYYSANVTANLVCSITDAANGEISFSLPASTSANVKAGRYLFDVKTIDSFGAKSRVVEGIITILPQVTR